MKILGKERNILVALLCNIVLAYAVFTLCRLLFVAVNYDLYSEGLQRADLWLMFKGALRFDTAAICYLNALYVLCLLFPLHYKESTIMQHITKGAYIVCNAIGIIANLCDIVYVPFTGRRTTWSLFSEFSNEGNMAKVIGTEIINHWYLVLIGILLIWLLYILYTPAKRDNELKRYYLGHFALLIISIPIMVTGIRGGVGRTIRPISLNDANQYIVDPGQAAIVLNTPFSMIRTIGKNPFKEVRYFDDKELTELFSPIRNYSDSIIYASDSSIIKAGKKNIVIFIMESFGKEYIGAYNPKRESASLTPFLDSLISVSRSYRYSYGNGRKSIDGMPSVLSGIPMFVEPFFVTPASLNKVSGIAGELADEGYYSAFFHGAPNGSMGFQAFAKATGFKDYYGMSEYNASPLYSGKDDFDGSWAIWDEPFFQYYSHTMSSFKQPFVAAMFSASSHHPFAIPEQYKDIYKERELPIYKCVQYTDNALRSFFAHARQQEWFKNTIFVITADHSNQSLEARYKSSSGFFEVPIIFYDPTGNEPFTAGIDSTLIAQQNDIMPTLLHYLGYERDFLSFGKSLLSDTQQESYAVNWLGGLYQYFKGDYLLQFDGEKNTALINVRKDPLHQENLLGTLPVVEESMQRKLKAIIQQYMARMLQDRLVPGNDKKEQ